MKQLLILLIFIGTSGAAFSQSDYNDYPASSRTDVFVDDFDDNQNEWMVGELKGSRSASIENGHYYWKAKSTRLYGSNESWKKLPSTSIKTSR